jgi:hypothetical protein
MKMDNSGIKKIIEEMIINGYVEIIYQNSRGDDMFRFTDKFFDDHPEILEQMQMYDSDILSSLWFKDFIEIKMSEDNEMYISCTDKSHTWSESDELNDSEKAMMYDIIMYLMINNENKGE